MTAWSERRAAVEKTRIERKKDWANALIVQLRHAVANKICDNLAPYRVEKKRRLIELAKGPGPTMKTKSKEVPAIALQNLRAIEDAKVSFVVALQKDELRIEQYTMSAVGKERKSGRPWFARIDLDPEQRGQGPCGHPVLHCHVGVDASEKGGQESRIPLPWLDPDEALAWLLATLAPELEPK